MTKVLLCITSRSAKIGLFLLGFAITACNTYKGIGEGDYLLEKHSIEADSAKVKDQEIINLLAQHPNSKVLGFPLKLQLYNLAKENPDSSYQAWLHRKPNREENLSKWLSKKQTYRLGESFLVKGVSDWLKKVGEPPAILDTTKTQKGVERLNGYYYTKGYFNNHVAFAVDTAQNKPKAAVTYKVDLGRAYTIDTLSRNIASAEIDSLYQLFEEDSYIHTGEQFDLANFNQERERLNQLFRNHGVSNFQESSITYNILRDTTEQADNPDLDVELNIRNSGLDSNAKPYKIQRFEKINIYADYQPGMDITTLDSIHHAGYTIFFKDKLKYRSHTLTNAVFMEKDSVYRDIDWNRTTRQISNLNTFKYPNIKFSQDSTGTKLTSNIYLTPRDKFSLGVNTDITHSNIQDVGVAFSASLITRNVFGGAETLSLSARGSLGLLSDANISNEKYVSEVGGDVNLTFPSIMIPFISSEKIIPHYMLPQTRINLGTSFQKNIGLDKRSFNGVLGFNWTPSDPIKNSFEPIGIEFVRNLNPERYFAVYSSSYDELDELAEPFQNDPNYDYLFEEDSSGNKHLIIPEGTDAFIEDVLVNDLYPPDSDEYEIVRSIDERQDRLTENNLIFSSSYTFTKNTRSGISDNTFYQLRLKLESAGGLLSGISELANVPKDDQGRNLVFGVPYSQYVKGEIDYIKHWQLSHTNVLAFRGFIGLAIPYANSYNIPFVRSYFAGGSNDNRAWNAYSLGPGKTGGVNDFNDANFKMAFNLEYRFPLFGDIKGALFTDIGNIWNLWDNVTNKNATFNGFSSLGDLAVGTGIGLRYDLSYFVIRLDTGFKTYNPDAGHSGGWFKDYNFRHAVYNIGINYPF